MSNTANDMTMTNNMMNLVIEELEKMKLKASKVIIEENLHNTSDENITNYLAVILQLEKMKAIKEYLSYNKGLWHDNISVWIFKDTPYAKFIEGLPNDQTDFKGFVEKLEQNINNYKDTHDIAMRNQVIAGSLISVVGFCFFITNLVVFSNVPAGIVLGIAMTLTMVATSAVASSWEKQNTCLNFIENDGVPKIKETSPIKQYNHELRLGCVYVDQNKTITIVGGYQPRETFKLENHPENPTKQELVTAINNRGFSWISPYAEEAYKGRGQHVIDSRDYKLYQARPEDLKNSFFNKDSNSKYTANALQNALSAHPKK